MVRGLNLLSLDFHQIALADPTMNTYFVTGLFDGLDRESLSPTALCVEAVNRVIRSSLYPPEQKERLRNSVNEVILGSLTINAAANKFGLVSFD